MIRPIGKYIYPPALGKRTLLATIEAWALAMAVQRVDHFGFELRLRSIAATAG
jgi:hypothetical protein